MAVGNPHLKQVELAEEAQALRHTVTREAALLGHVVDGDLHVAEQLILQEKEEAQAISQYSYDPSSAPSSQKSVLEPGATCSSWVCPTPQGLGGVTHRRA